MGIIYKITIKARGKTTKTWARVLLFGRFKGGFLYPPKVLSVVRLAGEAWRVRVRFLVSVYPSSFPGGASLKRSDHAVMKVVKVEKVQRGTDGGE